MCSLIGDVLIETGDDEKKNINKIAILSMGGNCVLLKN